MNIATEIPSTKRSLARKQIGSAIWLLAILGQLCRQAPSSQDGATWLATTEGQFFSDAQLAQWLEVTPRTVVRWRLKLRKIGVLDWLAKPKRGRLFILQELREPSVAPFQDSANQQEAGAKAPERHKQPESWVQ